MLVDIHAHLTYPPLMDKTDKIIKNAKNANVKAIISNGTNPQSNREVLELSKKYSIVKPALGYFPDHIVEDGIDAFKKELEFIKKQKPIALGEIGLDFARYPNDKLMIKSFEEFISLSEKKKIPMIIHSRKATKEVLEILESSKAKVILHYFCGRKSQIKKGIDLGFSFSISTNIIRLQQLQDLASLVPITQLLTETDCPWLSPYGNFPEFVNEPAFIKESIKKIAKIKKMNIKETQDSIFMNYQKLFL